MINKKYQRVVYTLVMSLLMSGIMSFVVSLFNIGLVNNILSIWLKAWSFSFLIAFPTVFFVSPVVAQIVNKLIRDN